MNRTRNAPKTMRCSELLRAVPSLSLGAPARRSDPALQSIRGSNGQARRTRRAAGRGRRPAGPGRVPRGGHLLGAEAGALVAPGKPAPRSRPSARSLTTRWGPSSARTRTQGRAAEDKCGRASTKRLGGSSPSSPTSRSANRRRSKDMLGRVYEYFLAKFASAEGKGGQSTPTHVVRVLVEMLEPYKGRVCDPCCGSGGMLAQIGKIRGRTRRTRGRHRGLRAGIQLHHLEGAGMNLAFAASTPISARATPAASAPICIPTSRPITCSPTSRSTRAMARRALEEGQALGLRRAAGGQRELRLDAELPAPWLQGLGAIMTNPRSISTAF